MQKSSAAPLATFRIFFGLLMLISLIRFAANGWIEKLYLEPSFHFKFYGFEWVQPLGPWTYLLFIICGLAAIGVSLGYRYRLSTLVFFLSFTYIELMDKTTYLNHYYFVSVMSFLLLWLPADRYYSLDALRKPDWLIKEVPQWSIDAVKLMLAIVYFYAGLAKLNSDWLLSAQPLATWLPTRYHLPLIGPYLREEWMHFAMSWAGALYDLLIPFLLWNARTRPLAFVAVVVFHILTRVLFPIGMFPYIMIVGTLIFFSPAVHERMLATLTRLGRGVGIRPRAAIAVSKQPVNFRPRIILPVLSLFFAVQLLLPFRYLMYPGELFWTEQGFRFSWRVMLMEKAGYAQFKIVDAKSGKRLYVDNSEYLNAFQEKQMSFQPDFILEYAHYLAEVYQDKGFASPEVYVESYVALNGRSSQPFVDPTVNLAQIEPSLKNKTWLLPFNDEIKGF
ncbi:MAG: HTTM domain-containing protein [Bacteroidota bacterium]